MTYEEKMRILSQVKPEYKDIILARILKGERKVRITGDEDLFYSVNRDRVSLEEFTNRDKFKAAAEQTKLMREHLNDKTHGYNKSKKMKWLGDIPAEIFFSRPEFSPNLPKAQRDKNIRKFLNTFQAFKGPEKI